MRILGGLLVGGLLVMQMGCGPRYELQRILSPMGYAWYGDLERLRQVHKRLPPDVEAVRWIRAVDATISAMHNYARYSRMSAVQERDWKLSFARRLIAISYQAREPFARWAVASRLSLHKSLAQGMLPILAKLLHEDPVMVVRKQAIRTMFAMEAPMNYLLIQGKRALEDPDYWVRASVLLSLTPFVSDPKHSYHSLFLPLLTHCIQYHRTLPRERSVLPQRKRMTPRQLLFALRRNCLYFLPLLSAPLRVQALSLVRDLKSKVGPLQADAHKVSERLLWRAPIPTSVPSSRPSQRATSRPVFRSP